ncbi:uncharacterized protein MYCFIDRAFT_174322 [Pseudocercospora fijiensis CIRAD86]|uniref:Uncharacterized protein n=1 Tax=Pseudocercospora fijiensis (strain CIRAD86) TaxID=383855 RepID=M3B040_PSEFD|nr:uncharacterized protein MYCFIDRAFT_174322 [Pseudocercospora fijiensis CIRAD86]EME82782.1 hypothetical protein MYCFIDRAFT_174322 [Pseudocercospora fijiensis CIRAD86]
MVNRAYRHAVATGADEALMDITPLSTAAGCAPFLIVKQLLAHCPLRTSFQGELLHWAARRQSDDADQVVRLILERCQPDINGIMYKGDPFSYELQKVTGFGTALHEVAKMGQLRRRPDSMEIMQSWHQICSNVIFIGHRHTHSTYEVDRGEVKWGGTTMISRDETTDRSIKKLGGTCVKLSEEVWHAGTGTQLNQTFYSEYRYHRAVARESARRMHGSYAVNISRCCFTSTA